MAAFLFQINNKHFLFFRENNNICRRNSQRNKEMVGEE